MLTPAEVLSPKTSADVRAQIDALRDQVATLVHGRAGPIDDASRLLNDRARAVGSVVLDQAAMLSSRVRERPAMALLLAAGVGYLVARLRR